MAERIEYAQLAAVVYAASNKNKLGIPAGWTELDWQPDQSGTTGFSAGAYRKGNDIVIAYTGTNDLNDIANWSIGLGLSPFFYQVTEAVAYYQAFRATYPDTNFSFTGHSLGGGLASLMAVYFDKPATTFDEAPFQLAALSPVVLAAVNQFMSTRGISDAAFTSYSLSGGLLALSREYNINHYSIEGEVLSPLRTSVSTLVGAGHEVDKGESTAGAINLHSMTLLMAALESPSFLEIMQKLPSLVEQMLDTNLFGTDQSDDSKQDLLRHLLRHQFGADGITKDDMLDRFGTDLGRLAGGEGNFLSTPIVKALIGVALQHYYQQSDTKEYFFQQLPAGIQFDLTKPLGNENVELGAILGYEKLLEAARGMIPVDVGAAYPQPEDAFMEFTAEKVRWNAALGEKGLQGNATGSAADLVLGGAQGDIFAAGEGNDLLLGGLGSDVLQGEAGDDTLYGGADNDTLLGEADTDKLYGGAGMDLLDGGEGDDTLVGGDGRDVYRLNAQSGTDHIEDDSGVLLWQGHILAGSFLKQGDGKTYRNAGQEGITLDFDSGAATLKFSDGTQVILSRQTSPGDFAASPFGIQLEDKPGVAPLSDREIIGDLVPIGFDSGASIQYDDLGNVIGEEREMPEGYTYTDELFGSAGNDHIQAKRGNDWVQARGGDDVVVGGEQVAEQGYQDYLMGEAGNDTLHADEESDLAGLKSLKDFGSAGVEDKIGDALFGGQGNDTLAGSNRHDVMLGGGGGDLMLGGAGDDVLVGNQDRKTTDVDFFYDHGNGFDTRFVVFERDKANTGSWTVGTGSRSFQVSGPYYLRSLEVDLGGGSDIIYGGAGDELFLFADGMRVLWKKVSPGWKARNDGELRAAA
ncbi:hypothetical protein VX159_05735 [Dechloromonas sp. ZY10]|uniref:lipase family protein n=1 Tax=Dechloromonas aquae TaxID=2664436 RepID=UPI00352959A3